eukprot:TRINITY_DN6779_c0_g1_i3.p1 TRINITY_DN6779_c0_g1~~TRINITY_DN6779_c0_g1_i3.p1  ORF type:complete len:244 (+),score=52.66 TRINITY_DN6779_c0_g1_i3:154-885(+)
MTRHLDDGTLRTIIERCKEAALQSVTPVILLTTGSFNPIHRQHVNMHIIAKAHLEQRYKVRIVMSVLSPSSDLYVKPKLRASGRIDRHLTHAQRCQLIELATQDHPDIVLDNWEGLQPEFIDSPDVQHHLQSFVNARCHDASVPSPAIFAVVGSDALYRNLDRHYPAQGLGIVVVIRAQEDIDQREDLHCLPTNEEQLATQAFFVTGQEDHVSSSQVCKLLANKQRIEELVHPAVASKLREWL